MTAVRGLHRIADETGSVYWWPIGLNFKRGLSRCSQGQGTWAWQYQEQWLGVKVDAVSRTITVAPRGLVSRINWRGLRAGESVFDLAWEETASGSRLQLKNENRTRWTVQAGFRPFGAGADSMVTWKTAEAQAGATVVLEAVPPSSGGRFSAGADVVRAAELSALGEDGVVFRRYGPVDPFPDWYHLWSEEHLDVRFCVLNGTGRDWSEAKVSLFYPAGWSAKGRKPGHWPEADRLQPGEATVELGAISSILRPFLSVFEDRAHYFRLHLPWRLPEPASEIIPRRLSTDLRLPSSSEHNPHAESLRGQDYRGVPPHLPLELVDHHHGAILWLHGDREFRYVARRPILVDPSRMVTASKRRRSAAGP